MACGRWHRNPSLWPLASLSWPVAAGVAVWPTTVISTTKTTTTTTHLAQREASLQMRGAYRPSHTRMYTLVHHNCDHYHNQWHNMEEIGGMEVGETVGAAVDSRTGGGVRVEQCGRVAEETCLLGEPPGQGCDCSGCPRPPDARV